MNRWHALTAAVFFVAMWGLAISSDRMVVGDYATWSRVALCAALMPTIWGVILLAAPPQGVSKMFAWVIIVAGMLVVFIGRSFGCDAFREVLELLHIGS